MRHYGLNPRRHPLTLRLVGTFTVLAGIFSVANFLTGHLLSGVLDAILVLGGIVAYSMLFGLPKEITDLKGSTE